MLVDIRCSEIKNNTLFALPDYFKRGWLGGDTLKKAYFNMKVYKKSSGLLRETLDKQNVSNENYILAAEQVFLYGKAGRRLWISCVQNYIAFKMSNNTPDDDNGMWIELVDECNEKAHVQSELLKHTNNLQDILEIEKQETDIVTEDKEDLITYSKKFDKEHIWMFDAGHNGRRDFRGNPKYLFVYINKYRPDICAYWYCEADAGDVIEQVREQGFKGVCQGTEEANIILSRTGVVVSEQLREFIPSQLMNAKYLNLWHGIGFKRVERARMQDSDDLRVGIAKKYISYNSLYLNKQLVVATSPLYEKEFIEDFGITKEQIIRAGYTRCMYQKSYESIKTFNHDIRAEKGLADFTRLAVYAPTFRNVRGNAFSSGMKNLDKLHEVCVENNILLIFKVHPHIEKEQGFINAWNVYGKKSNFYFWDNKNDFYEIINQMDLVIYDYSSMFSDFLCAGVKHFIRYIYDEDEYMKDGFTQGRDAYYERTCGSVCHTFDELLEQIASYEETDDSDEVEEMYQKLWGYAGENDFEKTIQAVFDFKPENIKLPTLYSYDVFDTLISRKGLHPYSIFQAVKERMKQSGYFNEDFIDRYPAIRHSAEMNVRERYRKTTQIRKSEKVEISFDEIFERLADVYNLTGKQQDLLKKWEIEEEINSVVPIESMIDEIKIRIHKGEDIVLISDMYLPKAVIRKMLAKVEPELDKIPLFVSSEYGYQKTSRLLYFEVYRSFKPYYKFGKWIHCGDTPTADKVPARRIGIETRLIDRVCFNTCEEDLVEKIDNYSAYLVAAMSARLRTEMSTQFKNAEFVINVVAMTLVPYVDWVLRDAIKKGFDVLYFVARDGQPLKLIADAIIKVNNWKIETRYLYASRRTWRIQSYIDKVDDIFWIQQGGSFNDLHNKEELFKALMIDEETFREILPQIDLDSIDWLEKQPGLKLAPILRTSDKLNQYLLKTAAESRKLSCEYLLQEFDENKKFACVEYWGRGYNQECMTRLWNHATGKSDKTYYYYARSILPTEGLNVRYNATDINMNVAVMEAIFANMPYKSIEEYEKKDGKICPIIEKNELYDKSMYDAMNMILPLFAERYARLEIVEAEHFDRRLFDYCIEYVQNNKLKPLIAENIGRLCDSMSMHGKPEEYARAYTKEDLARFSAGIPRSNGTGSIQMSYARASEDFKKQYDAMYQVEVDDDPARNFVLKPDEVKRNSEFKKKYENTLSRAKKAEDYYRQACSENHVYPKVCIVSNSPNFDSDSLAILNKIVMEQQKLCVEWISAAVSENKDKEFMNTLSMARAVIIDGNIPQLIKVKFRKETVVISLLDRGFRLYKFGKQLNVRLKWQKRYDALMNEKNVSAIECTSQLQHELSGFNFDSGVTDKLIGACVTDVLFDEEYKAAAYERLWSIIPEAKNKKIIFYMPLPRKRKNSGNWLELLDIEMLQRSLSDEYFMIIDFSLNNALASSCKNIVNIPEFSRNISNDKISLRQAMVCADIIIGDYRDTFYESCLMHKPVFSTAVDMGDIQSGSINMMYNLSEIYPFPIINSSENLIKALQDISDYKYECLDSFAENFLLGCDGRAAQRVLDYALSCQAPKK